MGIDVYQWLMGGWLELVGPKGCIGTLRPDVSILSNEMGDLDGTLYLGYFGCGNGCNCLDLLGYTTGGMETA